MPSPLERPPITGIDPKTKAEIQRKNSDEEPLTAFVFKTLADPYAGKINLFRVFSGILKSDTKRLNSLQIMQKVKT